MDELTDKVKSVGRSRATGPSYMKSICLQRLRVAEVLLQTLPCYGGGGEAADRSSSLEKAARRRVFSPVRRMSYMTYTLEWLSNSIEIVENSIFERKM
jgi:hypothetical protein